MKNRKKNIIITGIICFIITSIVVVFYFLLIKHFEMINASNFFVWVLQKQIPVDTVIFDKRLQYLLLTILYVSFFVFFCKLRIAKTRLSEYIMSVVFSAIFAFHIYISDTLMNYRAFLTQYVHFSRPNIGEFAFSHIWGNSISEYGFSIVIVNFIYLLLILTICLRIRTFFSEIVGEPDDFIGEESQPVNNYKETNAMMMLMLYLDDNISYRSIVDFIDSLPPNDIGLSNLLLIDRTIGKAHPMITSSIKRAKLEKFKTMLEENEKKTNIMDKSTKVIEFPKYE